ncbi:PREDICTED: uncharacterized protein LOC106807658 [Priapulus caudatus]|uniref:Uncharacterized protein LOC106807658 n=1 Tax=Priapulus caudatus TaxID=37621 RepID=A0ABM1E036_PRICU|nr:PREDICTED: uncharacterized protein LOC106807658 [Priapulus caudatus]
MSSRDGDSGVLPGSELVPNIVHFIRFGQPNVTFTEMVCMLSAYRNIKPRMMYVHCDTPPSGPWWEQLRSLPHLSVVGRARPREIFGIKVNVVQHASDIARIEVLLERGGIYLDNDVYVVKPFDVFRYNDTYTVGMNTVEHNIGNQIQIAAPNATFLRMYYNSYRAFNDSLWYYNAGQVPAELLRRTPSVARVVGLEEFGVNVGVMNQLYRQNVNRRRDWHEYYAIHLFYHHRHYIIKEDPIKEHDPENIKQLNTSFGQMMRKIYYGTEDLVQ